MSNETLSNKEVKNDGGGGYSENWLIPFVKLFLGIQKCLTNPVSRLQCQDGE